MADTVQSTLDLANQNNLPAFLRKLWDPTNLLGFGAIIAALRPRNRTLSGLTSSATQVHDQACMIWSVQATAGTGLIMVSGAAAGAGEVRVEYSDTTGVPTFTFGDGAVTGYTVMCSGPLPQNLAAAMATEV
jgi:hypothetical protein